ncbi:MAG: hypothetical protein HUJ63_07205, partial [Enterococcus sp.]|nr:hypothetical protein [Enterococcus sp.]
MKDQKKLNKEQLEQVDGGGKMAGLSQDRTFYAQDRIIIRGSSENPAEDTALYG